MMGYEMNWASFNVIEVMSSPKFAYKRIGYVAACQSFKPETEVLMLATNLIKKVSITSPFPFKVPFPSKSLGFLNSLFIFFRILPAPTCLRQALPSTACPTS